MWIEQSSLLTNIFSVVVIFFLSIIGAYHVGRESGYSSGFKEACGCKSAAEIKFLTILEEKLKADKT